MLIVMSRCKYICDRTTTAATLIDNLDKPVLECQTIVILDFAAVREN